MSNSEQFESLFSYGTLQDEEVQLSTFGRTLAGEPDILRSYLQGTCGPYLNIKFTGQQSNSVRGTRFEVTKAELEEADIYEATADYKRVEVQLNSGSRAWVYLNTDCE
jgi:gamma-glutamylcyclotransferase (GGCT)/AIG2-like uncharacterized protein YtfP